MSTISINALKKESTDMDEKSLKNYLTGLCAGEILASMD